MLFINSLTTNLVRLTGLEPALREQLDPKSSASTNSATSAYRMQRYKKKRKPLSREDEFSVGSY
jgi:hypothetical protein